MFRPRSREISGWCQVTLETETEPSGDTASKATAARCIAVTSDALEVGQVLHAMPAFGGVRAIEL